MTGFSGFLFPHTATVFDRLAFRRLSRPLTTGLVFTVSYPPGGQLGARPAEGWHLVCIWVDGERIRKRPYGPPFLLPYRHRKAFPCEPGLRKVAVTVGDSRGSILDSVEVDLTSGRVVHLKVTPELETFLGENDRLGICAIQDRTRRFSRPS